MRVPIRASGVGTVCLDGGLLDAALREATLSVGELVARAGVSPVTVWRGRRGEPVRARTARKLAAALGLTVTDLLGDRAEAGAVAPGASGSIGEAVGGLVGELEGPPAEQRVA